MRKTITTLLAILIITGCLSCDLLLDSALDNKNDIISPINLRKPEIGQLNKYRRVEISNFWRDQVDCEERGDTLLVEVVGVTDSSIMFVENLSEGSESQVVRDDDSYSDVGHYNLKSTKRFELVFSDESFYFISPGNFRVTSNLLHEHNIEFPYIVETFVLGWNECATANPYISTLYANLEDYRQNGMSFDSVYAAVDNEAMAGDGPGFTYIYNTKKGIIKSYSISPWTSGGTGWELIEAKYKY